MTFGFNKTIDHVIDHKTGIIKTLSYLCRGPEDPLIYIMMSRLNAFDRFTANKADFATTGSSLVLSRSRNSSVGEAIERYSAATADFHDFLIGSYAELLAGGYTPLAPTNYTYFSDSQYDCMTFPYTKPSPALKLRWIRGIDLIDEKEIYLPAGIVFNQFRYPGEPAICPDIHPGVASGSTYEHAVSGALLEIIERDSMMLFWMLSRPVIGISFPNSAPTHSDKWGLPKHLKLSLILLPNEFDIPCVYAILCDIKNRIAGAGCSAAFSVKEAIAKSVCEAVQTYYLNREVPKGANGKLRSIANRISPNLLSKDKRGKLPMTEVLFNLSFYQNEQHWGSLTSLLNPSHFAEISTTPDVPLEQQTSRDLLSRFMQSGLRPICVDLTTPDVSDLGWVVCRIVIPGLIPNFPSAYLPLGISRLQTLANQSGGVVLNTTPIPYS
jgi:ribosomal protein S12 methylthiotransferase accessory factor